MSPPQPSSVAASARLARVVAITLGPQTIISMGSATMPTIAPKLAEDFGVDPALIGYQVGIAYGAAALGALFGSGVLRRLGPCRASQLSLAVSALGLAAAALPSLLAVILASCLIGGAIGLIGPPAAQLIVRFAPPSQFNLVFSLKQTGVPLGYMLTALSAPAIALVLGWRWSLALVAALGVTCILLLQRGRDAWDRERTPNAPLVHLPFEGIRAVWVRPEVRYLVLCGAAYSAVQVCVSTFTIVMLVREHRFDLVQAGLVMSAANVAGVLGRVTWGWIADRWSAGQGVLVAVGVVMSAGCILAAQLSPAWPLIAFHLVFVALGASAIGWNGILHAEVARLTPPELTGLTASGTLFFVFGSICVTPALATTLYGALGSYGQLFATLTGCGLLGIALVAAARRHAAD